MYVIPLIVLVVLGLIAVAWSPIFALIIFVPAMIGFFAYVGMSRRADQKITPPQQANKVTTPVNETDEPTGMWGERRPQE